MLRYVGASSARMNLGARGRLLADALLPMGVLLHAARGGRSWVIGGLTVRQGLGTINKLTGRWNSPKKDRFLCDH
ncbi:hypothetical protein PS880_04437 [Pseudomonas fluorescens]|uniref:Uncharacterized protein n=1 Tax=Pseudomonas fluorescens TaxID=294 RepID=A0A5E7N767_PSEFL|nr:hypothetical protein PS880_04437 [Pseudomonas fluorescens]